MADEKTYPDCMCCADSGIQGGVDWPAAFCLCPAGARRRERDPQAADRANAARVKVRGAFG